jgi:general secretion pathway protein H
MVKAPISAISPDRPAPPRAAGVTRGQRGFTLIELLVVMAIGSLLVALVPPAFDRLREVSQYRDTVRALVTDLRQARQQALALGRVVNFRVDLTGRKFGIAGSPLKPLPASLELKATVAASAAAESANQATIAFLPDGGATGGTLDLARQNGAGVRIQVDWLSGHVTQEPRTP